MKIITQTEALQAITKFGEVITAIKNLCNYYANRYPEINRMINELTSADDAEWVKGLQSIAKGEVLIFKAGIEDRLYEFIKHGDAEHKLWLMSETKKFFVNEKTVNG